MSVLEVKDLNKAYPAFTLNGVSFSLKEGHITGFIGRNGAGKTTTLKSLLNFVHPDGGEVLFFGANYAGNELEIKQNVGFLLGGIDYYPKKKLKTITSVTKSFYDNWNSSAYARYMREFELDENKTPEQLSAGMRVKYALALALSHDAKLLILDEPTSGLDPVSRDDLLDVFMELRNSGITILFSTHITSDLDKCADDIIYIKNGEILAESTIDSFVSSYRMVEYESAPPPELGGKLIGRRAVRNGFSALIKTSDLPQDYSFAHKADLETIMVHIEKERE